MPRPVTFYNGVDSYNFTKKSEFSQKTQSIIDGSGGRRGVGGNAWSPRPDHKS